MNEKSVAGRGSRGMRLRLIGLLRGMMAAFLLMGSAAQAGIRVEPMAYELTPSGSGARQDLRVENTSAQPTPVDIFVHRREILPDGSERRTPADDDFLIFPPQGIVPGNGFQAFRVQYIGPAVTQTVIYTVTVAQQPVDTSGSGQSGVQIVFNLGTLAAVSPPGSTPRLVVESVAPAAEAGKLRVTVANEGNRYARLRTGRWTLTDANGATEILEGEPLQRAIPQPLIEPGTRRVIELPVGDAFVREGAAARYELLSPAR